MVRSGQICFWTDTVRGDFGGEVGGQSVSEQKVTAKENKRKNHSFSKYLVHTGNF